MHDDLSVVTDGSDGIGDPRPFLFAMFLQPYDALVVSVSVRVFRLMCLHMSTQFYQATSHECNNMMLKEYEDVSRSSSLVMIKSRFRAFTVRIQGKS